MYRLEDIRVVHMELTDRCNAACPQCPRNDHGGAVNPRLPLTSLSRAEVEAMLPPDLVRQLTQISVAGNYGDPIVAPEALEIFRYWREASPELHLRMGSNGSARTERWWRELARVMTPDRGRVVFAIDGLEDTNATYRRNTRWHVIVRNAAAYIDAGGTADWNFLVFRHNEHQVEPARELAREMGFRRINFKVTTRFIDRDGLVYREREPIKAKDGRIVDWLERPLGRQWHTDRIAQFQDAPDLTLDRVRSEFGSFERYLDSVSIRCSSLEPPTIFISAEGYVLPCCYLAGQIRDGKGGLESINAKQRPLRAILDGPFFQDDLPASWTRSSCAAGKNRTCARVCGTPAVEAVTGHRQARAARR